VQPGAEVAAGEAQPDVAAEEAVVQPGAVVEEVGARPGAVAGEAEPAAAGAPGAQDVPEGEQLSEVA
jgi:hypothetical protein